MSGIPEGFSTVTPMITIEGADKAIELYKKAFGAEEAYPPMLCPDTGKVMHACLQIGNSVVFVAEAMMECKPAQNLSFYLYVPNADDAFKKARAAGLDEKEAPNDSFWGDRMGTVTDPFGVKWVLAHHVRDVSPEEMEEAMKKWAEEQKACAA